MDAARELLDQMLVNSQIEVLERAQEIAIDVLGTDYQKEDLQALRNHVTSFPHLWSEEERSLELLAINLLEEDLK